MDIDRYGALARATAVYPDTGTTAGLIYTCLGLAGEAGEVADKAKRLLRDGDTAERRVELARELGDVLWYVAATAYELGIPISSVARDNLQKLRSRHDAGTLHGDGDDR